MITHKRVYVKRFCKFFCNFLTPWRGTEGGVKTSLCEGGAPKGRKERALPRFDVSGNGSALSPTACGRSPLAEGAKKVTATNHAPLPFPHPSNIPRLWL